ncbi:MAG: hypothetical protein ACKV1O_17145 [Saprospiraceae bacterium]
MKYLEPAIIVIDDVKEEIQGIIEYYSSSGIGCKLFNPDYTDGDTMPETPYSDLSIIYLDLYYSGKFDSEQCCNWIRSLICEKSFYILILWTKDTSKSTEVIDLLKIHNRLPFISIIKSKNEYQLPETIEGQKYNFNKLFEEINQTLEKTPALEEILIWKKGVKSASNEIIGNLTKNSEAITSKLKKIIISHGGESIKSNTNDNYKRSVLFDALDTVLISNTRKSITNEINELNINGLYNLQNIDNPETDKELNSWFHFKLEKSIPNDIILTGLISKNNHNFLKKLYSIQDDPKVERLLSKQAEKLLLMDDIALVISRPCDVAQKKYGKNIKLLSGIISYNPKRDGKGAFLLDGKKPDFMKIYDHLFLDDQNNDVSIIFDYRYVFSVPEKIFIDKFKNIKIFNKELLSEIQVEYSSYSSRLGITQII